MDVSKNEIEDLHFKHTPAARLYPKDSVHKAKGIEYVSPSYETLEKKLKDLPDADKHKGLIEFEHNQHKFMLNWLWTHCK